MGVDSVLVLDGVKDVERVIAEIQCPANDGIVFGVNPDSFYHSDAPLQDRVFVALGSRYWRPGHQHNEPFNWRPVPDVCRQIWSIDPAIVVHYRSESLEWFGDMPHDRIIETAERLTPVRIAELNTICDREEHQRQHDLAE